MLDFKRNRDPTELRGENKNEMKIRTCYKARLIAKGYEQEYGVDFWATFSPNPRMTTVWMLIALAAYFGWDTHQLDIETAFLNAECHAECHAECRAECNAEYHADILTKPLPIEAHRRHMKDMGLGCG